MVKKYGAVSVAGLAGAALAYLALPGSSGSRSIASAPLLPEGVVGSLPAEGRSLFDRLFGVPGKDGAPGTYAVPFPFTKLLERVQSQVQGDIKGVLIPKGRSLQRNASAPDKFFKSPRVVIFVDGQPKPNAPFLKDRLYIGYHERAAAMEIISYNDKAARFEFQVVRDYRENGKREVFYADRQLCTSCHQGQSPIFSLPNWTETNAHDAIVTQLLKDNPDDGVKREEVDYIPGRLGKRADGMRTLHGIPFRVPISTPRTFQDAVDRANRLAPIQALWRKGCIDAECRAQAFISALQLRLAGKFDRGSETYLGFEKSVANQWRTLWPRGIGFLLADIKARDPMQPYRGQATSPQLSGSGDPRTDELLKNVASSGEIPPELEPLTPRTETEEWLSPEIDRGNDKTHRTVEGVAEFISKTDALDIDRRLRASSRVAPVELKADCTVSVDGKGGDAAIEIQSCKGAFSWVGSYVAAGGELDPSDERRVGLRVRAEDDKCELTGRVPCPLFEGALVGKFDGTHLTAEPVSFEPGLSLRDPKGRRIASLELTVSPTNPTQASAVLKLVDDFSDIEAAVSRMVTATTMGETVALGDENLRREAVLERLYREAGWLGPESVVASEGPAFDRMLARLPAPKTESIAKLPVRFAAFEQRCVSCHGKSTDDPPNYLFGSDAEIEAKIKRCAPRIGYRLRGWLQKLDSQVRPMPPSKVFTAPEQKEAWLKSDDLRTLIAMVEGMMPPALQNGKYLTTPYKDLPICIEDND